MKKIVFNRVENIAHVISIIEAEIDSIRKNLQKLKDLGVDSKDLAKSLDFTISESKALKVIGKAEDLFEDHDYNLEKLLYELKEYRAFCEGILLFKNSSGEK